MAIKDRDGNIYKLKGPNPLMKTQDVWDKKHIKLINFDTKNETIEEDPKNPVKEFEEQIPDISKIMAEPEPPTSEDFTKLFERRKVSFLAVQAVEKTYRDELYGSSYSKTEFSEKLNFYGIVTEDSDFTLTFWSMQEVGVGSIVYPKNDNKRWWLVQQVAEKSGGHLHSCVLSDLNPSF